MEEVTNKSAHEDAIRYKQIPFEVIAKCYEENVTNIRQTCKALKIDRNTFMAWRKKFPELNSMLCEIEEGMLDFGESKLLAAINEGNLTAIIFYLKTKGKHRGYIEGQIVANINTNKSLSQEEAIEFLKKLEDDF